MSLNLGAVYPPSGVKIINIIGCVNSMPATPSFFTNANETIIIGSSLGNFVDGTVNTPATQNVTVNGKQFRLG